MLLMTAAVELMKVKLKPAAELVRASPRKRLNIVQARCHRLPCNYCDQRNP